ncbi:MAG: nuclear transport factor 2 family protein [Lewinellaceae bacterium]|nr:nuclear transport factor 2 family protein [Lewinellaceae bacterium]
MNHASEVVIRLFVAIDQRDWLQVKNCFAPQVELDYSSMTGQPAAVLSPTEIIQSWKGILPGFEHTHHQLGNFITAADERSAHVFCYGTATHFLPDEGGNLWTVVGSYDFGLSKDEAGNWKVAKMKFNFKYQDGNTNLPEKAMAKLKR